MELINKDFQLSEEAIKSYHTKGYVKLAGLFTEECMQYLLECATAQIVPSEKHVANRLAGIKYDLENNMLVDLFNHPIFKKIMRVLTKTQLLFTHDIAFKIEKTKSSGLGWHVGEQSFGYQRIEDYGCTMWTPLIPIDNSKQKGGMAYIPENILSGEFIFKQMRNAVVSSLNKSITQGQPISSEQLYKFENILNTPVIEEILGYHIEADDFNLGDAFLFNKMVIHRSIKMEDGPMEHRLAYVMRFIDSESKYDQARVDNIEATRIHHGNSPDRYFYHKLNLKDGDLIRESDYFENVEERLI
ncbi:MAG: hypothetical protein ACPGJS_16880 [Flammeovirgaceae bacterium]